MTLFELNRRLSRDFALNGSEAWPKRVAQTVSMAAGLVGAKALTARTVVYATFKLTSTRHGESGESPRSSSSSATRTQRRKCGNKNLAQILEKKTQQQKRIKSIILYIYIYIYRDHLLNSVNNRYLVSNRSTGYMTRNQAVPFVLLHIQVWANCAIKKKAREKKPAKKSRQNRETNREKSR